MIKMWFLLILCIFPIVPSSGTCCRKKTIASSVDNDFKVYWNVPTFMCHKYGMFFEEVSSLYGIKQNDNDEFLGDEIFILYDPGYFPALLRDKNGELWKRNGGVPQEGDLTQHLEVFEKHVHKQVPNKSFRGIAVIDFESWRPIFRQNWASLNTYRKFSIEIEKEKHPYWSKNDITKKAVEKFETYGREFMEKTLKLAKKLRPLAQWGYYAYPYCFNYTPNQPHPNCNPRVFEENDRLFWLFPQQQILFPSVYLRKTLEESKRVGFIKGRISEALRLAGNIIPKRKVMPYLWYKYEDSRNTFLSKKDVENGIWEIVNRGSNGLIIWGSSNDLNSKKKCEKLRDYLKEVLGPIVSNIQKINAEKNECVKLT